MGNVLFALSYFEAHPNKVIWKVIEAIQVQPFKGFHSKNTVRLLLDQISNKSKPASVTLQPFFSYNLFVVNKIHGFDQWVYILLCTLIGSIHSTVANIHILYAILSIANLL